MKALSAHSGELSDLTDRFEKSTIFVKHEIEICSYYELVTTAGVGQRVSNPHSTICFNVQESRKVFVGANDFEGCAP
jgi:hypothetical protein